MRLKKLKLRRLNKRVVKLSVVFAHTCRRLVRFPIIPDKLPDKDWLGAPLQNKEKRKKEQKLTGLISFHDETRATP